MQKRKRWIHAQRIFIVESSRPPTFINCECCEFVYSVLKGERLIGTPALFPAEEAHSTSFYLSPMTTEAVRRWACGYRYSFKCFRPHTHRHQHLHHLHIQCTTNDNSALICIIMTRFVFAAQAVVMFTAILSFYLLLN